MTEADRQEPSPTPGAARRTGRAGVRKLELDQIFGDVLPDITSDERSAEPTESGRDDWHLENRPPHHDR